MNKTVDYIPDSDSFSSSSFSPNMIHLIKIEKPRVMVDI